jgi:DNA mismatch endonuclease (patch repair protein)
MTDKISPLARSENMKRIRSKGMKPEMVVRSEVFKMGHRYRLHVSGLPGKPDLVFPGRRLVIFVNGCFWHQHANCVDGKLPKSRQEYWVPKLRHNIERDAKNYTALLNLGWRVEVIWECETRDIAALHCRLRKMFLNEPAIAPPARSR